MWRDVPSHTAALKDREVAGKRVARQAHRRVLAPSSGQPGAGRTAFGVAAVFRGWVPTRCAAYATRSRALARVGGAAQRDGGLILEPLGSPSI